MTAVSISAACSGSATHSLTPARIASSTIAGSSVEATSSTGVVGCWRLSVATAGGSGLAAAQIDHHDVRLVRRGVRQRGQLRRRQLAGAQVDRAEQALELAILGADDDDFRAHGRSSLPHQRHRPQEAALVGHGRRRRRRSRPGIGTMHAGDRVPPPRRRVSTKKPTRLRIAHRTVAARWLRRWLDVDRVGSKTAIGDDAAG